MRLEDTDVVESTVEKMVKMEPNLKGREAEVRIVVLQAISNYLRENGIPQGTAITEPRQ